MLIAIVLGITFGILSAIFQNKPVDYVLRTISVSGVSLPSFWFALLMMNLFCNVLGVFPSGNRFDPRRFDPTGGSGFYVLDAISWGNWALLGDVLAHLFLPALVLGFFTMGLITRQTRSNLLEAMSSDYIRTARAKGMKESRVVIHHALGNALVPVITVSGMGFCNLLGAWSSWRTSSPGPASASTPIWPPPTWTSPPSAASPCSSPSSMWWSISSSTSSTA